MSKAISLAPDYTAKFSGEQLSEAALQYRAIDAVIRMGYSVEIGGETWATVRNKNGIVMGEYSGSQPLFNWARNEARIRLQKAQANVNIIEAGL